MKLRLHACLWLGLLAGACEKSKQAADSSGETPAVPRVTRKERPPPERAPDVRKKLRGALANASDIDSPAERDRAVSAVAWDALELDPELAREAMDKLTPDGPERISLLQHVAMRMAEENPDAALEWAAALGTESEKAAAFGRIALVLADTDPERAANLLSESGIEGRTFDVAVVQVLGRWAEKSPADAAAWVAMFPPGNSREAGIKSVISRWTGNDPAAAFSWMAGIQDEAVRGESAQAAAEALIRQPETVREEWLGLMEGTLRSEIEARWEAAKKETGLDDRSPAH
jgi:hypothetical protein